MTFNEGMQIDTSTTSASGGGGRGIAIGGGLGGLLFLVVALLLGVDPGKVATQLPASTSQEVAPGFDLNKCRTGADANQYVQCRVIATGNSVDAVWKQLHARIHPPPGAAVQRSGQHRAAERPAPRSGRSTARWIKTAYFDTGFFDVLRTQFGSSGGPLAQEYVVAHEFGHHVQDLQGSLGRAQQGAQGAGGNGVRTELQADCYAGVWAHYASTVKQEGTGVPFLEPLSDKDISDALSAAASVGDDRIQKAATGRTNPESWTHGSSEQRQHWFTVGYQTGDPNQCDTFRDPNLN